MRGMSSKSTSAALPGPSMCDFPVGSKPAGETQTLPSSLVVQGACFGVDASAPEEEGWTDQGAGGWLLTWQGRQWLHVPRQPDPAPCLVGDCPHGCALLSCWSSPPACTPTYRSKVWTRSIKRLGRCSSGVKQLPALDSCRGCTRSCRAHGERRGPEGATTACCI